MHEEWRRNKYGGLFKVTNDYMNKKIREGKQKEIPEENQGINYGDLGKGGDTSYGRMDGSRDTGHFGTGTYFVSPKGYASESYKKRPSNTIDFSEYDNLYKPSDGKEALALHDYLRNINRGVDRLSEDDYWKVWRIRSSEDEDYDYFSNTYKKLKDMNYNPLTYDEYKNDSYYKNYGKGYDVYLDDFKDDIIFTQDRIKRDAFPVETFQFKQRGITNEQIKKALQKVKEAKNKFDKMSYDEQLKQDSLSTIFMKELGFNGIDVRFIPEVDDTTYGSVIYDLNKKRK